MITPSCSWIPLIKYFAKLFVNIFILLEGELIQPKRGVTHLGGNKNWGLTAYSPRDSVIKRSIFGGKFVHDPGRTSAEYFWNHFDRIQNFPLRDPPW